MARGDQLTRQWRIIQALTIARGGKTVQGLSKELGCHTRTVYRDLEALQQAGFPVYTETEGGRSRWALLDSALEPVPVPFRLSELLALYFSRDMIRPLKGTPFYDAMETLFQKIRTTLPETTTAPLDRMTARLGAGYKPYKDYSRFSTILETVRKAMMDRRYLDITYFSMSRGKTSDRRVAPYHMWFFDGTFYLIGFCERRKGIRTFAVDRIRTCDMTEAAFDLPDSFDPDAYMAASFGIYQGTPVTVRVRFSSEAAGYIRERVWHKSQMLTPEPDGSLIFEAEVADSDEIRFWILSWGANAEVLSPEPLRTAIQDDIRAMAGLYGG